MTEVPDRTAENGARIVIIGAGPAAAMLLERIIANHGSECPELLLDIRLVDPHEPGGGRIWRRNQSPLLKLNSMFADVAFFTDASCTIAGPITPGPTLSQWAELVREGSIELPDWADEAIFAEVASAGPQDFPTRRLNNAYLSWAYRESVRRAAPTVSITWVKDLAVAVNETHTAPGSHTVRLASGAELIADTVIYALGHNGALPTDNAIALGAFADRHGLGYVAPGFTADLDLDWVPAGEAVIVRGMGLAAVDLTVLLTEGRGGIFSRAADGSLSYAPSGREPQLYLGSRRGVPYRSKISSSVVGDPVELEYLGSDFRGWVQALDRPLDFDTDVWPRIAADLVTGYYRELFTGHPERVSGPWAAFAPQLRAILQLPSGHDRAELRTLIAAHVPDADDRFDLAAFQRPLVHQAGLSDSDVADSADPDQAAAAPPAAQAARLQQRVREHIAQDLRQRSTQEHSATQALFLTALYAHMALAEVPVERWNAVSRTVSLPERWQGFFSYLASGPPAHRLEELLALSEAGVVQFLGGDVELKLDQPAGAEFQLGTGRFVVSGSASIAGTEVRASVRAHTLIDAWLPSAAAATSDNRLLRQLIQSGQLSELRVADANHAGTTGQIEVAGCGEIPGAPGQFALGAFTSDMTAGAFTRPGFNSLPFRQHDRLAREVLAAVAGGFRGGRFEYASQSREEASRELIGVAQREDTIGG